MGLRRGFKTEANRTAREVREELGLASTQPLCPFRVINHLEVPIAKLSEFKLTASAAFKYLARTSGKLRLSALTASLGAEKLVIYNDRLPPTRVRADLMHEAAHMLLMHPPHPMCGADGAREYIAELEDEANWLGPALLVSEEAALSIAKRGTDLRSAASDYGVSPSLMRMRLNVTGAHRRARRALAAS